MTTEELILKLVEALQSIAPEMWRILLKQTYTEAFVDFIWGILFSVIAYKLYKITVKYVPTKLKEDRNIWNEDFWKWEKVIGLSILCGSFILLAFGFLLSSFMWFYNPEFYAIRFLLHSITP